MTRQAHVDTSQWLIGRHGRYWPTLNYAHWRDTAATLQLWTQIVGKVRLALSPWLNHGWHVPLYVNARGLGTSPIHAGRRVFEIDFDLVDHRLIIRTPDAHDRGFGLEPMSVASFYRLFMSELDAAGINVAINVMPNEVPDPIPFPEDEVHCSYDAVGRECIPTSARAGGPHLSTVPNCVSGQGEPGAFLLGQLRPRRHAFFRAQCAAASWRCSGLAGCRHTRGLLA